MLIPWQILQLGCEMLGLHILKATACVEPISCCGQKKITQPLLGIIKLGTLSWQASVQCNSGSSLKEEGVYGQVMVLLW